VPQQCWISALCVVGYSALAQTIPPVKVGRTQGVCYLCIGVAQEHAKVIAGSVLIDQLACVGVARQKFPVIQAKLDQFVDQSQQQRPIGTGFDGHPLIGNGGITGAHRVDGDKTPAIALELGEFALHRIGVVVFGGADHHEQLGTLQVGATKFPKRATDGVDHASGHIDRAKAAVRCVVGGAELARKETGKRLHLVPSGKQCKFLRVCGANFSQTIFQHGESHAPLHFFKLTVTALTARLSQQGLGEPGWRILLHDARGTLGANDTLIQWMIRVAFDVAHFAVAQMDPNAAPASAHVARGCAHLVDGVGDCWASGIVNRYDGHA